MVFRRWKEVYTDSGMHIKSKIITSCVAVFLGAIFFVPNAQAALFRSGILVDNANLREAAGYTKVISVLPRQTVVSIIASTTDWLQVATVDGTKGWVNKRLIGRTPVTVEEHAPAGHPSPVFARTATSALAEIISDDEINEYWQAKINTLRKAKGLRELAISGQLARTSSEWAEYLGRHEKVTHARPDGKSPRQWIEGKGIDFTERNSEDGWKKNYFAENLGLKLYIKPTVAGVKTAMDAVLHRYLTEGPSGPHFRSIYHSDWNSFGASCYPVKNSQGTYSLYFVFHYGSLML